MDSVQLDKREASKASSIGYFSSQLNCFSNCLAVLEALPGRWRRAGSLQSLHSASLESCGASFIFGSGNLWFVGVDGWGIFQSLHSKYRKIGEQGNPSNTGPCLWSLCDAMMFPRHVGIQQGRVSQGRPSTTDPEGALSQHRACPHEGPAWPGRVPENHLEGHECPQLT